jgi:hypothetical protein
VIAQIIAATAGLSMRIASMKVGNNVFSIFQ